MKLNRQTAIVVLSLTLLVVSGSLAYGAKIRYWVIPTIESVVTANNKERIATLTVRNSGTQELTVRAITMSIITTCDFNNRMMVVRQVGDESNSFFIAKAQALRPDVRWLEFDVVRPGSEFSVVVSTDFRVRLWGEATYEILADTRGCEVGDTLVMDIHDFDVAGGAGEDQVLHASYLFNGVFSYKF